MTNVMTPDEIAALLHACDLMAPAGDATTTRLNGADIWPVVKAARAYAEMFVEPRDIDAAAKIIAEFIGCDWNEAPSQGRAYPNLWNRGGLCVATQDDFRDYARRIVAAATASPPAPAVADINDMADDLEMGAASIEDAASMLRTIAQSLPAPAVAQDGVTDEMVDAAYKAFYAKGPEDMRAALEAVIAPLLAENARQRHNFKAVSAMYDEASQRASRAEADANRLAEALERAEKLVKTCEVFVTSNERIKRPEGEDWFDEELSAIRAALAKHDKGADHGSDR